RASSATRLAILAPLEHPLPPGVDVCYGQGKEEHQHLPEDVVAQHRGQHGLFPFAECRHCPRIKEQEFDVEYQEEDGDEIEFHVEALARIADGIHSRFVCHELDRRVLPGRDEMGCENTAGCEQKNQRQVEEDREVRGQVEIHFVRSPGLTSCFFSR